MTRPSLSLASLLLPSVVALMPGCIAWEIRDEMRQVNQHLGEIDPVLLHTRGLLANVKEDLRQTNAKLDDMQAQIVRTREQLVIVEATLESTDPKLSTVNTGLESMRVINDVQKTLTAVDSKLGPLSKTLGSLGGTLSFLGGGSEESDAELLDAETQTAAADTAEAVQGEQVAGADPNQAGEKSAAASASPRRRDLLVGTWLMEFPPPMPPEEESVALIFQSDGTYLRAVGGKPASSGRWERDGRNLTFTPSGAGPDKPGIQVSTVELMSVSLRTLTVKVGDKVRVYSRP